MARQNVLRLLRTLSRHPKMMDAWVKGTEAEKRAIIAESGGIEPAEANMLVAGDEDKVKKYLNEDADTAQQIHLK
jgi:hypothetical protein